MKGRKMLSVETSSLEALTRDYEFSELDIRICNKYKRDGGENMDS